MLISIIVPLYNEAPNLPGLCQTLQELTAPSPNTNFELILVDGGGKNKLTVMNPAALGLSNLQVLYTAKGRGLQLDAGAKAAKGDILLFLHGDTKISPQFIQEILAKAHSKYSWGCGRLQFDTQHLIFKIIAYSSHLRAKFLRACFGDQTIFCTQALYRKAGGFQNLPIMEDMFFSQAASKISKAILLKSTAITSGRRYKQNGIWRTIWRMQMVKLLYSLGKSPDQLYAYYTKVTRPQKPQK